MNTCKREGPLDNRTKCSAGFHDLSATLRVLSHIFILCLYLVIISLKYLLLKHLIVNISNILNIL